jgi:hypothetical protein
MIRFVQEFSAARVTTGRANLRVQSIFPRTPFLDSFRVADDSGAGRRALYSTSPGKIHCEYGVDF